MNYNKKDLVNAMHENLATKEIAVTKKVLVDVINSFTDVVMNAVLNGDSVKMSGFGTFTHSERGARQLKNPKTGEIMNLESYRTPKFKPSTAFKDGFKEA